MVVVTLVTPENGKTIYFEEPLPEANYVRLLSCSLYNSWHNLESVGSMFLKESGDMIVSLPERHYTAESIAKRTYSHF